MALANVYTQVYGQIPEFFEKIKEGQAPDKFTQQHLKDIGFTSTSHRAFLPLLKALGFLASDGSPTYRYHSYRDSTQSRRIMGEAIKEAYSDLFLIKEKPKASDKNLLEGKFKSTFNAPERSAEYMAKTFLALLELAELDNRDKPPIEPQPIISKPNEIKANMANEPKKEVNIVPPGLHYNIQIHLPATKDIEVYNSIFKSVKEHLFG